MFNSMLTILVMMSVAGQAPVEGDGADQRLEMLVDSVAVYRVNARLEGGETHELKRHPTPLVRFDNQVGGVLDGVVMMWTSDGRPAVVAQVFVLHSGLRLHEFQSMATTPLDLREDDVLRWSPEEAGVQFQEFTGAAAPAEEPERRLIQMKAIARQFTVTEDFRNEATDDETQTYRVRFQSNPVHRYGDGSGELIDGAMFAFVHGTDPEAFLLIEAVQTDKGPAWRYAFAPMTCWAMQAVLDEREVWTSREQLRTHHERGTYHIWTFGETDTP